MNDRLRLASKLLQKSATEMEKVKNQRDILLKMVQDIQSTILSKVQQHRTDIASVERIFRDYHVQFQSLISDVSSSFDVQSSNSSQLIKQLQYRNKCLRDQLTVRRVKYSNLSKRYETLLTKKDKSIEESSIVLRCMRCKARKNVITHLEQAITDRIHERAVAEAALKNAEKEMQKLEEKVQSTESQLQNTKKELTNVQKELDDVQAKLKEEMDKKMHVRCKIEADSSSSPSAKFGQSTSNRLGGNGNQASAFQNQQSTFQNQQSTFKNQQQTSIQNQASFQQQPVSASSSKTPLLGAAPCKCTCEKELINLQWQLTSKTSEINRLHNQMQTSKREIAGVREETQFFKNRSQELMLSCHDLNAKVSTLRQQLVESEQSRENLRHLLTNLAQGVSSAMMQ